jgi:hypothetical protein
MTPPAAEVWPAELGPRQSLLLVDDDAGSVQAPARMLAGPGELRFALSGEDAPWLAQDLAALDLFEPLRPALRAACGEAMGRLDFAAAVQQLPAGDG